MGWCSGTTIFDTVMDAVVDYLPNEEAKREVALKVAKTLWDGDWDCEADSKYWDSILVHIMHDEGHIDDEDYKYYTSFEMNPNL